MDTPISNCSTKPLVSVLVAVYNAAPYLRKALDSVLQQTYSRLEVLCVDDGSTDDSLRILEEYSSLDNRVKVFRQENQGPSVARNLALQYAKGEFVTMLDADDWLSKDCVELSLSDFHTHPEADVVVFQLLYEEGNTSKVFSMPFHPGDCLTGHDAFHQALDFKLHGLYMVRAGLHHKYLYDTTCKFHSDDNTYRLHYLHARKVLIGAGQYHYRMVENSVSHSRDTKYFDFLKADLSLRSSMLAEGTAISPEDWEVFEVFRWKRYVDKHWFLYKHGQKFTYDEQCNMRKMLKECYSTFHKPHFRHFGYLWFRSYRLFLIQEWFYFRLR